MSKRTALITGGSGFIGQHLISELSANGFSGQSSFHSHPASHNHDHFQQVKIDLNSEEINSYLITNQPEFIFHLAAISDSKHPNIEDINVKAVDHLVASIQKFSPESKLIFLSSAAVYGQASDSKPRSESIEPKPINAYGKTKLQAEKLILESGINAYICRVFNVIGPGQPSRFFLPTLLRNIQNSVNQSVEVFDPDAVRDFIDVRDVATALSQIASQNPPFGIYNVCSGEGRSIKETTILAQKVLNSKVNFTWNTRENPESIQISIGDPTRLQKAIGFKPRYTIEETLRSCT